MRAVIAVAGISNVHVVVTTLKGHLRSTTDLAGVRLRDIRRSVTKKIGMVGDSVVMCRKPSW